MKSLYPKLLLSSAIALFTSLPAFAMIGNTVDIDLKTRVMEICALQQITAVSRTNGSTLQITSTCNAQNFSLNLTGVNQLNMQSARPIGNSGLVSTSDSEIDINALRPGQHVIFVELGNTVEELQNLDISISIG